jgi:putative restriction endonuclease
LPVLQWNEQRTHIIVSGNDALVANPGDPIPPNDPSINRRMVEIAVRKGQKKLRDKLLYQYEGKCAITGCDIESVLHACHIRPFAESKSCLTEDAILLRADIHDLFDDWLVVIHPDTLCVGIHNSIAHSAYSEWHGKRIADRIDGGPLKREGLQDRWERFSSL